MWIGGRHITNPNKPYGVIRPNGINFTKSLQNPKSVAARILATIHDSPFGLTKREILTRMGYKLDVVKSHRPSGYTYQFHVCRGFLSDYFAGLRQAGFITSYRRGNFVIYQKGPNFPHFLNLI